MAVQQEPWLTELPDHRVTMTNTSQLMTRGRVRGWVTQPRAECSCGWGEGALTAAGMYALIRRHLGAHGWRAGVGS